VGLGLEFWRVFWKSELKLKREKATACGQNTIKKSFRIFDEIL